MRFKAYWSFVISGALAGVTASVVTLGVIGPGATPAGPSALAWASFVIGVLMAGGPAYSAHRFVRAFRVADEAPVVESHWGGYGGGLGGWRVSPAWVYLLGAAACGAVAVAITFQLLTLATGPAADRSNATAKPAANTPAANTAQSDRGEAGASKPDATSRPAAATDAASSRPAGR